MEIAIVTLSNNCGAARSHAVLLTPYRICIRNVFVVHLMYMLQESCTKDHLAACFVVGFDPNVDLSPAPTECECRLILIVC